MDRGSARGRDGAREHVGGRHDELDVDVRPLGRDLVERAHGPKPRQPRHRPEPSTTLGARRPRSAHFRIAENSREYNAAKEDERWLDQTFAAGWAVIARRHGLVPAKDQCLAWTSPPALGGPFEVGNLWIADMSVWQAMMGQLHEALTARDGR